MRRPAVVRPHRGPVRTLARVGVLALVAVLAVGCSDDGDSDGDEGDDDAPVGALTADQIEQAVLQPDNMGDGWTSTPSADDDSTAPGCLAGVEELTEQLERQDRGGTEFSYGEEALTVESTVSAYADEPAITALFDQVQTVIAACTTVTGADSDGNEWDLTLATTEEVVYDDVDDQYSVSGGGTITTPAGDDFEIYLEQTAVRVGPNVASISTFDVEPRSSEHAVWAEIAVERLVDVAEGEEPESTTAPAPAGGTA